jgi:hypothetical protein
MLEAKFYRPGRLSRAEFSRTPFSRARRTLFAGIALLLAGCIPTPPGPLLSGPLPPAAPGSARIVVYRALDYYATQAMPTVYLNNEAAGVSENGAVFYRDVAPGTYTISVAPSLPFPNQFKTITVKPGDVFYAEINTLPPTAGRFNVNERDYGDTFIVTLRDPVNGSYATQGLRVSG